MRPASRASLPLPVLRRVISACCLICTLLVKDCVCWSVAGAGGGGGGAIRKIRNRRRSRSFSPSSLRLSAEGAGGGGGGSEDATLLEALRARREEIGREVVVREQKWRHADCQSGIRVSLPDWIRRVDVDRYPLAACGSSRGHVYVANLETGQVLATSATREAVAGALDGGTAEEGPEAEDAEEEEESQVPENLDSVLRLLYGSYDGGGTLAIAFKDDLVCTAGRGGSVQIYRLADAVSSQNLLPQGTMGALEGVAATCLHLDDDYLWVGTGTGRLQAYPLDSDLPLVLQGEPQMEWTFSSAILSLAFCRDLGCGAVATAGGSVEVISTEGDDEGKSLCSLYPPFNSSVRRSSNSFPLCVAFVQHQNKADNDDDDGDDDDEGEREGDDGVESNTCYSIACGGNDGSIWLQRINVDEDGDVDAGRPFADELEELRPNHLGRVKCLASPMPGLLVSGGLDGAMRIWDVDDRESLYQFVGYKVWLGSLWTDGTRLVSDGSDNSIIVHDFGKDFDETQQDDAEDAQ